LFEMRITVFAGRLPLRWQRPRLWAPALLVVVSGACGSALAAAAHTADVAFGGKRLLDTGRHPRPERGQGGDWDTAGSAAGAAAATPCA